jgi:hypothetical protein
MIWSEYAIDYSKGFVVQPDGIAKPNAIGCYVMTIEECEEALRRRK